MKTKDIVVLVGSIAILITCIVVISLQFAPKKDTTNEPSPADNIEVINPNILEDKAYDRIINLNEYPRPTLEGIGKSDPFSN